MHQITVKQLVSGNYDKRGITGVAHFWDNRGDGAMRRLGPITPDGEGKHLVHYKYDKQIGKGTREEISDDSLPLVDRDPIFFGSDDEIKRTVAAIHRQRMAAARANIPVVKAG